MQAEAQTTTQVPIAEDFMTRDLVCVEPETHLYDAINILSRHSISGAPVVSYEHRRRRLVGILSEKDCLSILSNEAFYVQEPVGTVSEYMSKKIVRIPPNMDLFTVASLFMTHPFRRLPVVDQGFLVGQVSRIDVLRAGKPLW